MQRARTLSSRVLVLAAGILAGGCGAGLITGIAAANRGGSTGEVRPPDITLSPIVPLVPAPNTTRSIVVANVQIAATAPLRVRIDALDTGVDQLNPVAAGQGGSTLITFTLETAAIVARVADPTAADIDARLSVLVDDKPVAAPVPIVLARQPRAQLDLPPGASELFVSPFGERVFLRVEGLRGSSPGDLQLLVTTPDPTAVAVPGLPRPTITRVATDLRFEADDGGPPAISAELPGNTFPVRTDLVVRDAIAGVSTPVTNAYYRPDIALALPSQGPTTGGSLITLIGTALAPYDFDTTSGPPPFDFEGLQLFFAKGGRVTELPRADFRVDESGADRLVFTMPPAPDGRPGQVQLILRVPLGAVTAEVTASERFLFANPDPFFGPRGLVLDRVPVAIAPIGLDQAPSTDAAPDFAALTDQGGVAFLQLMLAQQNGMFQPFAAPRQIGDHEVLAEREPRDLCVGDFDGDGIPDVFIVNAGGVSSVHHLVLGQAAPLAPLGPVFRFATPGRIYKCRAARFDGDNLPDLLLVPGPGALPGQLPLVMLARPVQHGHPAFTDPAPLPVREFPYEAVEVADLDGDGHIDIALVSGTTGKLDVAYGNGDGSFTATQLDFTVPGYTFDPLSPAVGLHACADAAQQSGHQSLGLVLAGTSFLAGPTLPAVAVLRQVPPGSPGGRWQFVDPSPEETFFTPSEPIGISLVANLDEQGPVEMVIGIANDPQFISLGTLQLTPSDGFRPIEGSLEGGVVTGAESPRKITALVFGRAFPVTPQPDVPKAVFLVHEALVDGAAERRLSTRLVLSGDTGAPKLLPPDAGAQVAFRIENVIGGSFQAAPGASVPVRDIALARTVASAPTDAVVLVKNEGGFGGLPRLGNRVDFPGLLPNSLALVPADPGGVDLLVFSARDSHVGCWRHDPSRGSVQLPDAVSGELRLVLEDAELRVADLADSTRIATGDVDGDGVDDVVVLMSFALAPPLGEGKAAIALLRGKASHGFGEFPFHMPSGATLVHGAASAIALGDFTRAESTATRRLELAVAVPTGAAGDHLRFFRYQAGITPADDRLVPAAAPGGPQVLLAGSNPTQIAASDFDRDGSIDLLVACAGDSTLRVFRNTAPIASGGVNVEVGAFHESLASPWQLVAGSPTLLRLADVNGDGNPDAVVAGESIISSLRSTEVGIYLSRGDGSFDGPRPVSPSRLGNRNATLSVDLGDWNSDGLPDLFLGWNTSSAGDINLRVLFGGTR